MGSDHPGKPDLIVRFHPVRAYGGRVAADTICTQQTAHGFGPGLGRSGGDSTNLSGLVWYLYVYWTARSHGTAPHPLYTPLDRFSAVTPALVGRNRNRTQYVANF